MAANILVRPQCSQQDILKTVLMTYISSLILTLLFNDISYSLQFSDDPRQKYILRPGLRIRIRVRILNKL